MTMTELAIPRPSAEVDVYGVCALIEAQMSDIADVSALHECKAKLSAIDEYVAHTAKDGRAAIAATMRRLEVRIGEVLGAGQHGGDRRSDQVRRDELDPLSPHERNEFRAMAEHPDVVEQVIAASSDDNPASRRKVLGAIKEKRSNDAYNGIVAPDGRAWLPSEERAAQIQALAAQGYDSRGIAKELGIGDSHVREIARRHDVSIHADSITGRTRRLDSNRIVQGTVDNVTGIDVLFNQIDYSALDAAQFDGWVISLSDAIRSLTTLRNNLKKEMTRVQE